MIKINRIPYLLKITSILLLSIGLVLLFSGTIIYPLVINEPISPVGRFMVAYEVQIIPNIVYLKPITIVAILLLLGYLSGLEYINLGGGIKSQETISIIKLLSSLFMFIGLYEMLFNFMLWGSLISSLATDGIINKNIDMLINTFPNPDQSWNLVFATKIFTLLFFISLLTLLYAYRWSKES